MGFAKVIWCKELSLTVAISSTFLPLSCKGQKREQQKKNPFQRLKKKKVLSAFYIADDLTVSFLLRAEKGWSANDSGPNFYGFSP